MATKRIASQVHKQASRLIREGYIQREPAWYRAVLDNPPLPLPAREPPSRTHFDTPDAVALTRPAHAATISPLPVQYVEDQVRKQFFRDHPFEAFREKSLVENEKVESEHPVRGKEWKRLKQRGRNPSPEDAIRYAVNLYEHQNVNLSDAYASAVAQFRSLRSEVSIARQVALAEAEALGVEFGPSQTEITFRKESKAFETFQDTTEQTRTAETERKRWKAVVEREGRPDHWTKGQEYTRLWKEGVRPVYAPVFSEAEAAPKPELTPEQLAARLSAQADFLAVTGKA
ncbi:hypothetical protein VTO73DRAFT_600 [Trametes versicolor]